LRTPLATIEAALDGLQSGELVLSPEDRAELLDSIRLEHLRLKRLVEDLLDLSRLQAGAAAPALELWPADELIEQALEALPAHARARIEVVLPEEIPVVRVDAVQLQRALVNLLENALRWSPPGEPVTVRVNATRKEVLIRVVDRGQGVPEGQRERIFDPFHRLDSSVGAGLGLAIARGFAEANGGRLWVESRSGQGASFALALPAVEAPVEVTG
jgi:two-component system, OmpR family, sensor histidine kinase KdpD